jgi:RNA polymerase sigma-70 factor, ECF subfamily
MHAPAGGDTLIELVTFPAVQSSNDRRLGGKEPRRGEVRSVARQVTRLIEDAVDGLPAPHSLVFVLREVEGLDETETAVVMGVSQKVVHTLLHGARTMICDCLTR